MQRVKLFLEMPGISYGLSVQLLCLGFCHQGGDPNVAPDSQLQLGRPSVAAIW